MSMLWHIAGAALATAALVPLVFGSVVWWGTLESMAVLALNFALVSARIERRRW